MAKCISCGEKAGIGNDICRSCYETKMEAAAAEAERKSQEDAQRFEEAVALKVNEWEARAKQKLVIGEKVFLYKSIYVTVDAALNGQTINNYNFAPVVKAGLEGWRIEGIIPKTSGMGLKNVSYGANSGETWGGGVGGLVVAVYVMPSKEIKSLTYPDNISVRTLAQDLIRRGFELE
jgi:hypothetical protein